MEISKESEIQLQKFKTTKQNYFTIVVASLVISLVVLVYPFILAEFNVIQSPVPEANQIVSDFLIMNLKGDSVITSGTWKVVADEALHVNLVNALDYPDKTKIIKNAIMGLELKKGKRDSSMNDELAYYAGWKGALKEASRETSSYIPQNFEIFESKKGEGDITITLTDLTNSDGLSGSTKLILDISNNQILKAGITIYEVNKLTEEELATIVRHEFGHALGLGHSDDKDDIMYAQIQDKQRYISDCTVADVVHLYGEERAIQISCEGQI